MSNQISEEEIVKFLKEIEEGTVTLAPHHEPQDVYAGNVCYQASNGWEIVIFNDANVWDYIDCIQTSEGRSIDFDELEDMPKISKYRPSDEIAWCRYGIPGYCIFRCKRCGKQLKKPINRTFMCDECNGN
jgi:hypothetical protein